MMFPELSVEYRPVSDEEIKRVLLRARRSRREYITAGLRSFLGRVPRLRARTPQSLRVNRLTSRSAER